MRLVVKDVVKQGRGRALVVGSCRKLLFLVLLLLLNVLRVRLLFFLYGGTARKGSGKERWKKRGQRFGETATRGAPASPGRRASVRRVSLS